MAEDAAELPALLTRTPTSWPSTAAATLATPCRTSSPVTARSNATLRTLRYDDGVAARTSFATNADMG